MPASPAFQDIRRFPSREVAARAYQESQQALHKEPEECNLVIFRVEVNAIQHIVVLGDPPPTSLRAKLDEILVAGEPATIPDGATERLIRRMNERRGLGTDWFEGHYRR